MLETVPTVLSVVFDPNFSIMLPTFLKKVYYSFNQRYFKLFFSANSVVINVMNKKDLILAAVYDFSKRYSHVNYALDGTS